MSEESDLSVDWREYRRRCEVFGEFIKTDKIDKTWKCRICDKFFGSAQFSRHLRNIHGLSKNQYYQKYIDPKALNCVIIGCTSELPEVERLSHGFPSTCSDKSHKRYLGSCCQSMTMEKLNREWWQDEEYRKTTSERNAKIGFTSEGVSEWNKKNWEDEDYRNKMSLVSSSALRKSRMSKEHDYVNKKFLYCVKVSEDKLKLGIGNSTRLSKVLNKFEKVFTLEASKSTAYIAEYQILKLTEEYFEPTTEEEFPFDGRGEVRSIKALPLIKQYLFDRGINIDEQN